MLRTRQMEHYFLQTDFTWLELEEVLLAQPSAFVSYSQHKFNETLVFESNRINIKKRMREFLISTATMQRNDFSEKERCARHVMNERMRREKQKHNYLRLHSMLPSPTKRDKLSITTTAAREVEELKKRKEELERDKSEMNKMLRARESSSEGSEAKIRINVAHPSSGIDSMLEVLKCLKQTGSSTRLMHSKFLPQQFSAVLGIETKVGAAQVENATLIQVEESFRINRVEPSYKSCFLLENN